MKIFDMFLIFAQNIDSGYTLEQPCRGGSNEYPQSMFWSKKKKNRYTPAYPSFAIRKNVHRSNTISLCIAGYFVNSEVQVGFYIFHTAFHCCRIGFKANLHFCLRIFYLRMFAANI